MIKPYTPKYLYIEETVRTEPLAQTVLKNLPHLTPQYFSSGKDDHFSQLSLKDGKEVLVLAHHQGRFLKSCPCTKHSLCCGYFILESQSNCNYDCTYCILQTYLNRPPLIVYANIQDMLQELQSSLKVQPDVQFRIGTGEITDSLSLDPITEFTRTIVPFFAKIPNACIELKTKSAQVANLKDLDHRRHTIPSWSINTPKMARYEEFKAAPIEDRIEAAELCQAWGYPVSFHLEPLLYYPEWEEDYKTLIQHLFHHIDPKNVVWISIGGLRLMEGLKEITEKRFPKSIFLYDELIPGQDKKLRYLKRVRLELYRKISGWIREYGGDIPLYLCMESSDVWQKGLGHPFDNTDAADQYLGERIFETIS